MTLPKDLIQAIEKEITHSKRKQLTQASSQLSKQYRETDSSFKSDQQRLAYLAVRMPATYAAISRVFLELKERMPLISLGSLLDVGAGPGTVMWAIKEHFPSITDITLIEKDRPLANFGKSLAQASGSNLLRNAKWLLNDITCTINDSDMTSKDLVTASYLLNELPLEMSLTIVEKLWKKTQQVLVIVEPGTPKGFSSIRAFRLRLIELGAHLVAPCPHHFECPMKENDWCHFAIRLERTAAHRQMKDATLSYEDEKFSYVIASRESVNLPNSRVLRHPQKRSGHVNLTLCQFDGKAENKTLSRKQGELYQIGKKLEWGDPFNF